MSAELLEEELSFDSFVFKLVEADDEHLFVDFDKPSIVVTVDVKVNEHKLERCFSF